MFGRNHQRDFTSLEKKTKKKKEEKGFTLFEVVIGIGLVGIALLGLAQLFTYSVMNNSRSDRITNSTYLAQQQIDALRSLTADELNNLTTGALDEQIDVNSDGTYDFRRVTLVQLQGSNWAVRVMVFSETQMDTELDTLVQNPALNRVRADVNTLISR